MKIHFCLLGQKGLYFFKSFMEHWLGDISLISLEVGTDSAVINDYSAELRAYAEQLGVTYSERGKLPNYLHFTRIFAAGWRWMISAKPEQLIVIHDSLLPRYRGFAPLVNALLNREPIVGVTALFASEKYDCGAIIKQLSCTVAYPIRIDAAILKVSVLYGELGKYFALVAEQEWFIHEQDELMATYGLWLDEQDYFLDWDLSAHHLSNKINLLGYPYRHARAYLNDEIVELISAEPVLNFRIERIDAGKVIAIEGGCPLVVCGEGVIKIIKMQSLNGTDMLPLKRFRSRFR